VATFYDGGALRSELERITGVQVLSLHKKSRWDLVAFFWRLWKTAREVKPMIFHGYMCVSNELCLLLGRLMGAKVVWGLRRSYLDLAQYGLIARMVFRLGAWLSRFPDLIIFNSYAGKTHYTTNGYCKQRMLVIQNGIDTERFKPNREVGQHVRDELGVTDEQVLIGYVARLDPIKDHVGFLQAASLLAREREDVRFVCVGGGPELYRSTLHKISEQLALAERLKWIVARQDICAVYNAFDIFTSASLGEGFPNVVGEAMACGIPCVVTDVGDLACIVGDTGLVVPPKDPEALYNGWKQILALSQSKRESIGKASRARIVAEFSIDRLVEQTQTILAGLLQLKSEDLV
jgi:glycosyltransferase involved in cell wall biosynthesis